MLHFQMLGLKTLNYETIRLKVLKIIRKTFAEHYRKKLRNESFTIISNNCWGGMIYESYNLPKQSPTAGLFFMPEDYLTFLQNLEGFLSAELVFIRPEESRWAGSPLVNRDKRWGTYPVGRISCNGENVEIFFLHYHSNEEAEEKWKRRCGRIHWDKMLVKFNDQNGCTEELVQRYRNLSFPHKLFFTCRDWENMGTGGVT